MKKEYKTKSIHFSCENVKIIDVQERRGRDSVYWVVDVDKSGFFFKVCCFKEGVKIKLDALLAEVKEGGQKPARIEGFVSIAKGGTYLCLTKYVSEVCEISESKEDLEGSEESFFLQKPF